MLRAVRAATLIASWSSLAPICYCYPIASFLDSSIIYFSSAASSASYSVITSFGNWLMDCCMAMLRISSSIFFSYCAPFSLLLMFIASWMSFCSSSFSTILSSWANMSCSKLSFFVSAISFSRFCSKSYRDCFSISLMCFGFAWNLAPRFIL